MKWMRWGQWSAHLFDGDKQLCSTKHWQYGPNPTDKAPVECTDLSAGGIPFGKVCTWCLRISEARRRGLTPKRRCGYCRRLYPVSDAVAEESPFCPKCLHSRVANSEKPRRQTSGAPGSSRTQRTVVAPPWQRLDVQHADSRVLETTVAEPVTIRERAISANRLRMTEWGRYRRCAEWGWLTARIMAKMLYETKSIEDGFFIKLADEKLAQINRPPGKFERYRKSRRPYTKTRFKARSPFS